jgi:hypothetical protein
MYSFLVIFNLLVILNPLTNTVTTVVQNTMCHHVNATGYPNPEYAKIHLLNNITAIEIVIHTATKKYARRHCLATVASFPPRSEAEDDDDGVCPPPPPPPVVVVARTLVGTSMSTDLDMLRTATTSRSLCRVLCHPTTLTRDDVVVVRGVTIDLSALGAPVARWDDRGRGTSHRRTTGVRREA